MRTRLAKKKERKTCFSADADPCHLPAIQKGNKLLSGVFFFFACLDDALPPLGSKLFKPFK